MSALCDFNEEDNEDDNDDDDIGCRECDFNSLLTLLLTLPLSLNGT